MIKLSKFSPSLVLFLIWCAAGGCSPPSSPVLQVDLNALPRDAARLDVIVTYNGSTGSAMFFRDGTNNYTVNLTQPSPLDSPPQTSLAIDLPATTSGKVTIRAEARPAVMMAMSDMGGPPPEQPMAESAGCATATITPGTLVKATVNLMTPAPQGCP